MSRRPTDPSRRRLDVPISGLCLYGIGAGIMGVAAYVHLHTLTPHLNMERNYSMC